MIKAGIASSALFLTATASPFVGEHAESKRLTRDDGSTAVRMEPRTIGSTKYSHMIDSSISGSSSDHKSWLTLVRDFAFGRATNELVFENNVAQHKKHFQKGRLGQDASFTTLLDAYGGLMFVGEVLMGEEMDRMDVVFDTGSDWLVIEGDDCYNC